MLDETLESLHRTATEKGDRSVLPFLGDRYEELGNIESATMARAGWPYPALFHFQGFYYGYYSAKSDEVTGFCVYENEDGQEQTTTLVSLLPINIETNRWEDMKYVGKVIKCLRSEKRLPWQYLFDQGPYIARHPASYIIHNL